MVLVVFLNNKISILKKYNTLYWFYLNLFQSAELCAALCRAELCVEFMCWNMCGWDSRMMKPLHQQLSCNTRSSHDGATRMGSKTMWNHNECFTTVQWNRQARYFWCNQWLENFTSWPTSTVLCYFECSLNERNWSHSLLIGRNNVSQLSVLTRQLLIQCLSGCVLILQLTLSLLKEWGKFAFVKKN